MKTWSCAYTSHVFLLMFRNPKKKRTSHKNWYRMIKNFIPKGQMLLVTPVRGRTSGK
jgi:hypothetical protein